MTISESLSAYIDRYIHVNGGNYSGWYAGVTADPSQRLFEDHNVDKDNGFWKFEEASSSRQARTSEKILLGMGCQGGIGGGKNATYVYVYRITASTRE